MDAITTSESFGRGRAVSLYSVRGSDVVQLSLLTTDVFFTWHNSLEELAALQDAIARHIAAHREARS